MSKSNNSLTLPILLESTLVFEESLVKIKRDQLQIDQQPPYTYYSLLTRPSAVVVLALTPDEAYVLTEEYRHPTGRILLSCPGGYIDPGETPIEAAQRELLEETGFRAHSFTVIGSAFPYAGFSSQKTFYVRASGAHFSTQPILEVSEIIRPCLLTPEDLEQTISDGVDLDGTLCTALFFHRRSHKS